MNKLFHYEKTLLFRMSNYTHKENFNILMRKIKYNFIKIII